MDKSLFTPYVQGTQLANKASEYNDSIRVEYPIPIQLFNSQISCPADYSILGYVDSGMFSIGGDDASNLEHLIVTHIIKHIPCNIYYTSEEDWEHVVVQIRVWANKVYIAEYTEYAQPIDANKLKEMLDAQHFTAIHKIVEESLSKAGTLPFTEEDVELVSQLFTEYQLGVNP